MTTFHILGYVFNWGPVRAHWRALVDGAWLDVWITAISFLLACFLGMAIALLRLSRTRVLQWPAFCYVQVMRGLPLLVSLYWIYFGIAVVIGLNFTSIQSAILALTLTGSAYTSEIFRAGISAVDDGQSEAGLSMGLTRLETYRFVVFPQAIRVAIPPLGNTFVGLLKGATLISVIGVVDMVDVATQINLNYFTPFEPFTVVAGILVVLVLVFSLAVGLIERMLRVP